MKKLIIGLATVSVLGVGLFAMGGGCNKKAGFMKPVIMELNLSQSQKEQIQEIHTKSKNAMETPSDAFSENGFDKAKFIKISKSFRERRIEQKAENMEKIYNLLTDEQRVQFLKLIKERKSRRGDMKHRRGGFME